MTEREASSYDETMTFIPSERGLLFTIVTHPTDSPNGMAIVLIHGDGHSTSVGLNQFWVRTARRLAADGFLVVRFDSHGAGESFGTIERFELDAREPFVDDLLAIYRWLEEQGVERFAFVGRCGSARTALAAASRCPKLEAMVLLLMVLGNNVKGEEVVSNARRLTLGRFLRKSLQWRILRRLADPRWRRIYWRAARAKARSVRSQMIHSAHDTGDISPQVLQQFAAAASTHLSMLALWGDRSRDYPEFQAASETLLAPLLTGESPALEVHVLPGVGERGLGDLGFQTALIDTMAEWLAAAVGRGAEVPLRSIASS